MDHQIDQTKRLESQMVCGLPCAIFWTPGVAICVRYIDGSSFLLEISEMELLARLTSFQPTSTWLVTLCKENMIRKLNLIKGKRLVPSKFAEWLISRLEHLDQENVRTICGPIFCKYQAAIDSLIAKGAVITQEQALTFATGSTPPTAVSHIDTLCIPTCNRIERLAKCVESFSLAIRKHGRTDTKVIVVDDSSDGTMQQQNHDLLTGLSRKYGVRIRLIGRKERQRVVDILSINKAAPVDVLRFAFTPDQILTTLGAVRNTMALLTHGSFVLHSDDDTSCAFASTDTSPGTVRLTSSWDPCDTRFYSTRSSNITDYPLNEDVDPFAIHESILGKSIGQALSNRPGVSLRDLDVHGLRSLQVDTSQVNLTCTGASGDPGVGSSIGFLITDSRGTLERIYSSAETRRSALAIREVLRVASETTITRGHYFQSMSFGINNTCLHPPFCPQGRNQDGVFGRLYLMLDERSWIGHLPYGISHESESTRGYLSPFDVFRPLQLTGIVQLFLEASSCPRGLSSSDALRYLGSYLVASGSCTPKAFRSCLRRQYINSQLSSIKSIEGLVAKSTFKAKAWREDINTILTSIQRSISDEGSIYPIDLASKMDSEASLRIAQLYVVMYGKLLLHWESIMDNAGCIQASIM